jgi:hypothetical protein
MIRTHNVSDDRHWLVAKLPYDHDHDGPARMVRGQQYVRDIYFATVSLIFGFWSCYVCGIFFFILFFFQTVFLFSMWSYGSWICNHLCNQCLSPRMLWVRISIRARCTTLCDQAFQWLAKGRWFSQGPPVSSTNKTDCPDITKILWNDKWYDKYHEITDQIISRTQWWPVRTLHWL